MATWCEIQLPGCLGRATERHHRLSRAHGGSDDKSNTLDLCRRCHIDGVHGNPARSYEQGWLLKRGAA